MIAWQYFFQVFKTHLKDINKASPFCIRTQVNLAVIPRGILPCINGFVTNHLDEFGTSGIPALSTRMVGDMSNIMPLCQSKL